MFDKIEKTENIKFKDWKYQDWKIKFKVPQCENFCELIGYNTNSYT